MARSRQDLLALFQNTATEIVHWPTPMQGRSLAWIFTGPEGGFTDSITESTVISELGIDSLGMLEIVGSMERQLKIQIPDEMLAGIQTVKDLVDAVEKRQPE